MKAQRIFLSVVFGAMLTVTGCSDDGGSAGSGGNAGSGGTAGTGGSAGNGGMGGAVDTSGACGIICEGGEQMCVVEGFDPADGPETCTRACQAQWTNEQNCASQADFVITCVDANASCDTLDDETCGDFPSSALGMLLACIEG